MKLPGAVMPRRLLLAVGAAAALGAEGRAAASWCPCNELGAAVSALLQDRQPCSCIKKTPSRADLQAMDEGGLREHLRRCEEELPRLRAEKAAAEDEQEQELESMHGNLEDLNRSYNNKIMADGRRADEASKDMSRLKQESEFYTARRGELDREYNQAFTEWYKLTAELSQKVGRLHSCSCQSSGGAAMLARRSRKLALLSPEKKVMYDLVAQVEKCEAKSQVVSEDLAEQQSDHRKAVMKESDDLAAMKRRMADSERVAHLSARGATVRELRRGRDVLKEAADSQEAQVSDYHSRNADLTRQSAELEEQLRSCGC